MLGLVCVSFEFGIVIGLGMVWFVLGLNLGWFQVFVRFGLY